MLSQLRLFLQTKFLVKIGYQQANIAETLKIHPYRVKLAMQEVKNSMNICWYSCLIN
ncbi:hypothetical protein LOS20_11410 [Enterococcus faecium]|nr:hypothetical protein [Enterococcus faecium]